MLSPTNAASGVPNVARQTRLAAPFLRWFCALFAVLLVGIGSASAERIKDLASVQGVRPNQLIGYGLVVGLDGSGDQTTQTPFTVQSLQSMLTQLGITLPPGTSLQLKNVAAVMVTTMLPAFAQPGQQVDITVSSLGNAKSLRGGTLLMTPLMGNNKVSYAMAQGPLAVGGYKFEQRGTSAQKNFPTAGTIPEGAIAERTLEPEIGTTNGALELLLDQPDYTTANRVAAAINAELPSSASAVDSGRVRVSLGSRDAASAVALMARIEGIAVDPDIAARVVVNERTGTVVSGGDVYLSAVTVTHGDLRVSIKERFAVSQPEGLILDDVNSVRTVVVPEATVRVSEDSAQAVSLANGATIADLVEALRAIKVTSRDVIAILQGIKRAGALHAELVIQ
jgi:flagellar P-ring protein precursor FlgI